MKRKIAIFFLSFIVAFATSYAVVDITSAQIDEDVLMRGWIADDESHFVIAMETDGGSTSTARIMYDMVSDPDMIEGELDMMIVEEMEVEGRNLRTIGADEATLYGVITPDFEAALLFVARSDQYVYMMVMSSYNGGELDGEAFAMITVDVIDEGLEDVDTPRNYTEHEVDDDTLEI